MHSSHALYLVTPPAMLTRYLPIIIVSCFSSFQQSSSSQRSTCNKHVVLVTICYVSYHKFCNLVHVIEVSVTLLSLHSSIFPSLLFCRFQGPQMNAGYSFVAFVVSVVCSCLIDLVAKFFRLYADNRKVY